MFPSPSHPLPPMLGKMSCMVHPHLSRLKGWKQLSTFFILMIQPGIDKRIWYKDQIAVQRHWNWIDLPSSPPLLRLMKQASWVYPLLHVYLKWTVTVQWGLLHHSINKEPWNRLQIFHLYRPFEYIQKSSPKQTKNKNANREHTYQEQRSKRKEQPKKPQHPGFPRGPPPWY